METNIIQVVAFHSITSFEKCWEIDFKIND